MQVAHLVPEQNGTAARIRLCHLDELPDPGSRGFDPRSEGRNSIFLVRRNNKVFAYRDSCPHQGAHLAWRRDAYLNRAGDRIVCHAHGAQFDPVSGKCLLGPCLGQSLTALPLTISADGTIYLSQDQ
ncbi:MAG TPA: Rieske (2Fe-2S) protein [Xanthomonadales bacterium]|nr:Rieske (2Fe-2S) protein [Xanthomonadales bacterium]